MAKSQIRTREEVQRVAAYEECSVWAFRCRGKGWFWQVESRGGTIVKACAEGYRTRLEAVAAGETAALKFFGGKRTPGHRASVVHALQSRML